MAHTQKIETSDDSASSYGKLAKSAMDYSSEHYGDLAKSLTVADRSIRAFVAERPFVAVGMALAMGYVVARTINGIR